MQTKTSNDLPIFGEKNLKFQHLNLRNHMYVLIFRKGKENKMPYGLVHIRYNDKKLLFLVKQWIKEYKDTHCVGTQVVNEDAL